MIIDNEKAINLSRLGSRGAYGEALTEISTNNDNIIVVVADVVTSSRIEKLADIKPCNVINVGIAEQNMIGVAAGLANDGYTVFCSTFAPFASMRCFEQIRSQLGYMNLNVKVAGLLSGFSGGSVGNTHYGLEDLAIMRTIPNMTVLSPADCTETVKAVQAAAEHNGPVYIRLTGVPGQPPVYKEDFAYKIGKAIVHSEGTDVAIIATGTMVYEAIRASRALTKKEISTTVVDMHTIKPLDTELLDKIFKTHKLIVTVEEHSKIGGLGAAVAEYKAVFPDAPKQIIMGIPDEFLKAGSYTYMLGKCGLSAPNIVKIIQENI